MEKLEHYSWLYLDVFYKDILLHNDNGPALVRRYFHGAVETMAGGNPKFNGNTIFKLWLKDGQRHNLNGPAEIQYDEKEPNKVLIEKYWINGKQYTHSEYKKLGGK